MKITVLAENTALNDDFQAVHGLSLYIEANNRKILFDLGPDDTFLQNAKTMNIPITEVDTVIISHGHNDHGGGLEEFLKHNDHARIYIHEKAFEPHYSSGKFIGLDPKYKTHPQVVLVNQDTWIDENMLLFCENIEQTPGFVSMANQVLTKEENHRQVQDDFAHEQYLLLKEGEKTILITGCSHRGIPAIVKRAKEVLNSGFQPDSEPDINVCIGGFHLCRPRLQQNEPREFVEKTALAIQPEPTRFYTCHCTGKEPYIWMKDILGDQLEALHAGSVLNL